ncbi:MAG: hypothetical protein AB7G11_15770 [Phycisphaerales bacterium]
MIGQTIAIGVLVVGLVLVLSPGRALGVIVAGMLLWPEYMRVPLGVVQMSIPRAAALALVARLVMTGSMRTVNGAALPPLRLHPADVIVVAAWAWDVVANVFMDADQVQLVQMVGRVLDTAVMYFAARLALRTLSDARAMVGPMVLTAIVMGGLGAIESMTSWSYYEAHYAIAGNPWFDKGLEYRYGFLRAKGSAAHSIYFGVAMALLVGWLWSMRGVAKSAWLVWVGIVAAFVGALSSLSSGPQVALVTLMICGVFYYMRWAVKPAVAALVFLCVVVELASNRHFFQLADYLALSSETAWYRGRLMEVAYERIGDYWLAGVGGRTPHAVWGMLIDTRQHVDVVNHYIIVALYGGLLSLAMYVAVQVMAIRECVKASKRTLIPAERKLAFGLACTLIMLMVASMSIGLFGPPLLLSYLLMGAMVAVGALRVAPAAAVTKRVVKRARPMHVEAIGVRGAGASGMGAGVIARAMVEHEAHRGHGEGAGLRGNWRVGDAGESEGEPRATTDGDRGGTQEGHGG